VLGSFLDAPLPPEQDAVLAVGEVLAYRLDPRHDRDALPHVLRRCALALRPGGILLLDLPAPERARDSDERTWSEGDGWAVLVASRGAGGVLTREIVTFSAGDDGRFRRADETHELMLHEPADVLALMSHAGLRAQTLPTGYAGMALPRGLVGYLGVRRAE
jgi:SAM-dependent methyltransferase